MDKDKLGDTLGDIAEEKEKAKERREDPKQIREIVPIEDWITSSHYVGPIADDIYPFWRDKLIEFFNGGYVQLILDGSKSAGKTYTSVVAMLRKLYWLSCFEVPQRAINLSDGSRIAMAYLNINQKIAKRTGYSELRSFIKQTPYFKENFPIQEENVTNEIRLPKNVYVWPGSTPSSIISTNLYGVIIDEGNFYKAGGSGDMGNIQKVRSLYNDARERQTGRFQYKGQRNSAYACIISSSTHAKSFIEKRKREAGDETFHVRGVRHKVKPDQFADEMFYVFQGESTQDPQIIDNPAQVDAIMGKLDEKVSYEGDTIEDKVESLPESYNKLFHEIPVDLRHRFEDDIESSLQSIAGVAVGTQGTFFESEQVYSSCESESIPFAFNREEPVLSTGDSVTLQDYFNKDAMLVETDNGYYEPKMNPERKRFIHIDLSSTKDPTGMAMCHISGFKDDDGKEPIITYDFMVRIKPPSPPDRLSHEKIQQFVKDIKEDYGYRIARIGMDRYSSETSLQWFNNHVVPRPDVNAKKDKGAVYQSTDSDDEMWTDFVSLMHNDRVNFSPYDVFRQELFELKHDRSAGPKGKGKVDHPKEFTDGSTGHNDVSCAVVGAANLVMQSEDYYIGGKSDIDDLMEIEQDESPEDVLEQYEGQANQSLEDVYLDNLESEIIELM